MLFLISANKNGVQGMSVSIPRGGSSSDLRVVEINDSGVQSKETNFKN
jgi:hypothetical protein